MSVASGYGRRVVSECASGYGRRVVSECASGYGRRVVSGRGRVCGYLCSIFLL